MNLFKLTLLLTLVFTSQIILADSYLFKNTNLISMKSDAVDSKQDLLIVNGKIKAIGKTGSLKLPKTVHVIDASNHYLMPGLAEMHAHVLGESNIQTRDHYLYLYLINGVTTIRGMLGEPSHLKLRDNLATNNTLGPRLITSGPSFNGNSIHSVKQAKEKVKAQVNAGYDFLKLHPGLSREEFIAIADEAHSHNITFGGHIPDEVGVDLALAKKQATIDHLDQFFRPLFADIHRDKQSQNQQFFGINFVAYVDSNKIEAFAKQFAKSDSWLVPTETLMDNLANDVSGQDLAARPEMQYVSAQTVKDWIDAKAGFNAPKTIRQDFLDYRALLLKAIQQHHGKILLGSDAPQIFNVPGFSIHRELKLMVDRGLTPYQALKTGTVNVANFLNLSDQIGTLEVGKNAEMIMLSNNPLDKIENSYSIQGVFHNGIWTDKQAILQYLKNYLAKHAE
ncbi:amidohydrolase family protein [Kangiella sp. TOML190]|uniref:amidohydrolase family protein n=1 Tax=Kangiella sp. TOML190 TaxID=2931351 RepID=UPI0020410A55|nr:amidohydrolase family protein [Kangiella sp. TOML190]